MERCTLHVGRWVTKMIPKGIKMEPKGPNIDQKGAERGPKNIEKFAPGPGRSPPAERVEVGSVCV